MPGRAHRLPQCRRPDCGAEDMGRTGKARHEETGHQPGLRPLPVQEVEPPAKARRSRSAASAATASSGAAWIIARCTSRRSTRPASQRR
jgi:hypothetical protein